jgi:DNA-binding IclR family transcriptional regulator
MTNAGRIQVESSTDLVTIGERLGLYEALSRSAATPAELAQRTGAQTSFIGDWLANQASEGYITHDASNGRYANWCSWPRSN